MLTVGLYTACSAGGGTTPGDAATDATGDAPIDVPVEDVQSAIGAAGGSVASGAVSIAIPAGALGTEVEITIAQAGSPAVIAGVVTVGPTVDIGPAGTVFALSARVTLPWVAGALPSGTEAADVRLFAADAEAGPFIALVSTVDASAATVSAEVNHLSAFVPGVPAPPDGGDAPFVCPMHDGCDCDEHLADRPLAVLAQIQLERERAPRSGRFIRAMCYRGPDTLEVLSYSVPPPPEPNVTPSPDAYFLTTLEGDTLEVIDDGPTELRTLSGSGCAPLDRSTNGNDDVGVGRLWAVTVEGWPDSDFVPTAFYEEVLWVADLKLSFNRHLNLDPTYTDTNTLFGDGPNTSEARFFDDGSARFYTYTWFGRHIDVIHIDDLDALAANGPDLADEEGFVPAGALTRIELDEGDEVFDYEYDALHLAPDPDDPDADIVVAMSRVGSGVQGFRVWRGIEGLEVTPLPDLALDSFYGQFGWLNGGLDTEGRLLLEGRAGAFSNGMIVAIDPARFALVDAWEMGCLGAHAAGGFTTLSWEAGQALRFSEERIGSIDSPVMLVANGQVLAAGDVPFSWSTIEVFGAFWGPLVVLTDRSVGRAYVASDEEGIITAIGLP